MNSPADPANDRRAVPRHLRDSEHDGVRDTAASGIRKADAAGGRSRGVLALILLLALAAGVSWYVLTS